MNSNLNINLKRSRHRWKKLPSIYFLLYLLVQQTKIPGLYNYCDIKNALSHLLVMCKWTIQLFIIWLLLVAYKHLLWLTNSGALFSCYTYWLLRDLQKQRKKQCNIQLINLDHFNGLYGEISNLSLEWPRCCSVNIKRSWFEIYLYIPHFRVISSYLL